jgi:hypothetical protein
MSIIDNLATLAGARALGTDTQPLFKVVTPRSSYLYTFLADQFPNFLSATLSDAITALPNGSIATGSDAYITQNPSTIYIAPGVYTTTTDATRIIVPATKSGLRIYFDEGSELTTSAALTAANGLLEIEGRNVQLVGYPTLANTQATQTGSALIIGGSAASEGDGRGVYVENLTVKGDTAATDWVKPVIIRGAADVVFNNKNGSVIWGCTATTRIISVEAGNSRNSTNLVLKDVVAKGITDSGNTCVPLTVDASQTGGQIIGGEYTTDGSGKAIVITANDWSLRGNGLAGSTAAVGNAAHIDLVTATKIRIGQFYVKDLDGTTPASLFDQTNV